MCHGVPGLCHPLYHGPAYSHKSGTRCATQKSTLRAREGINENVFYIYFALNNLMDFTLARLVMPRATRMKSGTIGGTKVVQRWYRGGGRLK
jgi:hypothetical protein